MKFDWLVDLYTSLLKRFVVVGAAVEKPKPPVPNPEAVTPPFTPEFDPKEEVVPELNWPVLPKLDWLEPKAFDWLWPEFCPVANKLDP